MVTARRRGEALVAPEIELTEDDIGIYGADSIHELLERIAPEIDGTQEAPELVINGKRVDPGTIKAFSPEVLARLAILSPEAAARYGFEPGKRVVNLVLKKRFESWNGEGAVTMATRGGRWGERLSAGRFLVAGDLRWNVRASASHESRLLKSERNVPHEPDDELAVQAGLAPQRYATLLPSSLSASLNSGITYPVGDFSGTVTLLGSANNAESLLGLPSVEFRHGERGEPEPLRSRSATRTLGVTTAVSGSIGTWRTNVSLNFTRAWSKFRFDRPADDLGRPRITDRTHGSTRAISARIDARSDVLALPAGPAGVTLNLTGDANRSVTERQASDGSAEAFDASRRRVSVRGGLTLPVASRARDVLPSLGELSVDLGVNAEKVTGAPWRWRWNAGGTWAPVEALRVRASYEHEQRVPTFEQLHAPRVEAVETVFDFARQEMAEVIRVTGGNPTLQDGSARRLSIDGVLKPLGDQRLTFSLNYRRDRQTGGIAALPELTPAVEAVFPDRFIRDAGGRLIGVDARPINIESETRAQLTGGVGVRWTGSGNEPVRLSLALTHRWQLEDVVVTRGGIPPLDRLEQGGSPRRSANMQLVAARKGLGLTLNGNWFGEARLGGRAGYRYAPTVLFNLEIYAQPEHLWDHQDAWARDLKIALEVQNLLGGYRRVTIGGAPAPGFERDLIDPLGRTVRLTATKTF